MCVREPIMAVIPPLPPWVPAASRGARTIPAGRWFDAVQVDSFTAVSVLGRLAGCSGPVVEDQTQGLAWWLVAPRIAVAWELPGVCVLGHGHYVTVPPAEWWATSWLGGPPVRWLVPPVGSCLTDPVALYDALANAGARHG